MVAPSENSSAFHLYFSNIFIILLLAVEILFYQWIDTY